MSFEDYDMKTGELKVKKLDVFKRRLAIFIMRLLGIDKIMNEYSINLNQQMVSLRQDMRTLYNELDSNISHLSNNIRKIKPVLKIEDPEAVAFIKNVLSTHDKKIETQQQAIVEKINGLESLERRVRKASDTVEKSSGVFRQYLEDNGVYGLEEEGRNLFFNNLVEQVIKNKANSEKVAEV